jgi:hypothetical protein
MVGWGAMVGSAVGAGVGTEVHSSVGGLIVRYVAEHCDAGYVALWKLLTSQCTQSARLQLWIMFGHPFASTPSHPLVSKQKLPDVVQLRPCQEALFCRAVTAVSSFVAEPSPHTSIVTLLV